MNFKEAIEQIRNLLADNVPAEQSPVALAEVPPVADMPAPEAAPAEAPADPVAAMEARIMALEEKINAIIAKIEEDSQSSDAVSSDMAVQNQNFKAAIEKLTDIVDQLSQTPAEEPSTVQAFSLPKSKKDHLASIADNIASIKSSFKK